MSMPVTGYIIMVVTIASKFAAFLFCRFVAKMSHASAAVEAFAQDHLNDVATNTGAVAAIVLAVNIEAAWFLDPLCAALIALWIMSSWVDTGKEYVDQIAGPATHFYIFSHPPSSYSSIRVLSSY